MASCILAPARCKSARGLGCFLDDATKHNDALADDGAVEDAGDAFGSLVTQLEQSLPEGFRVRLAQIGAQRFHAASQHDVAGGEDVGQGEDAAAYVFAGAVDPIVHRNDNEYVCIKQAANRGVEDRSALRVRCSEGPGLGSN